MKNKELVSKNIDYFYNKASEETRLDKGMGVFEFERTKTLISKYLTSPTLTIIDVGGGTGKYAEWLAQQGHQVHLVEPILKHIHIAKSRSILLKNPFKIHHGEAQTLNFPNRYADLVIVHGPLYHLQSEIDRKSAIIEAKRILKPGGFILGFAINYTASTLVGLMNGLIHKPSFFKMCKAELTTGAHNPPEDFPWLLAEAFYHKPEKLKHEFTEQGLSFINIYAVEGMAWLDQKYFTNMLHPQNKHTLNELICTTETDPYLLPFSPHMMIVVKKES